MRRNIPPLPEPIKILCQVLHTKFSIATTSRNLATPLEKVLDTAVYAQGTTASFTMKNIEIAVN